MEMLKKNFKSNLTLRDLQTFENPPFYTPHRKRTET